MAASESPTLVGHGLYDLTEVGRLVGITVETLSRWTTPSRKRPALLLPQLDPFFSFHDLLTVQLIRELTRRKIELPSIATGLAYLQDVVGVPRPFAHESFATSGRSWLTNIEGQHVDLGQGGQLTWDEAIAPTLRSLTYGEHGMASVWRPFDRVWLNPAVQAGASCIDHSRTTTRFIWDLVQSGTDPLDIEWQFEIDLDDIVAARSFEDHLERRRPLQLLGS